MRENKTFPPRFEFTNIGSVRACPPASRRVYEFTASLHFHVFNFLRLRFHVFPHFDGILREGAHDRSGTTRPIQSVKYLYPQFSPGKGRVSVCARA